MKITASRRLTLINILHTAEKVKGLNLVGIVDAACPGVIADLEALVITVFSSPSQEVA